MKALLISILIAPSVVFAGKSNVSTAGGRYQLIQLSDMRRDQHLIDTQTGKVWTKTCTVTENDSCEMGAWLPDFVVGVNITEAEYYKQAREVRKFIDEEKKKSDTPANFGGKIKLRIFDDFSSSDPDRQQVFRLKYAELICSYFSAPQKFAKLFQSCTPSAVLIGKIN